MQELRTHKRISYRGQVLINDLIKAPCLSLGEGGLFVSTGYYFAPHAVLNLAIPLDRDTIKAKVEVRHAQNDVGFGAMFLDLTPLQRETIKKYVACRSTEDTDTNKKKILHIDFDPLKRRIYKGKLVGDGFIVFEAGDGLEALSIMQERDIDLVLMDLYLKELDGLNVIACIKKNPLWKGIPIIILSSKSILYDVKRAKDAGANEFLLKMTTTPIMLSGVVKKYLAPRRPATN